MKPLVAVIVENRNFKNFGEVVKSHMRYLPKGTDLIVFTTNDLANSFNQQLLKFNIKADFRIFNTKLPIPAGIQRVNGLQDLLKQNQKMPFLLQYCIFMTDRTFWNTLTSYERAVFFQMDTGLLREGIEEFLQYDYVGAPCYNFINEQTIMNGGLSIRNPRIMEYICRVHGWNDDIDLLIQAGQGSTASFFAEDIFFCARMIKYNIGNYPPLDIAKKFAVESRFELGTLGYHNMGPYLSSEQVNQVLNQYKKPVTNTSKQQSRRKRG